MNKLAILVASALLLSVTTFKVISAQDNSMAQADEKTVAWYVSHISDARQQNQLCYNNAEISSTTNCANARHALEISFKGNN